jgi:hypothetical protein
METTDPIAVIESLDVEVIRDRLAELRRQEDALRVLLRAALVRQRDRTASATPAGEGVSDDD